MCRHEWCGNLRSKAIAVKSALLILFGVATSAFGQIVSKAGMSSPGVQRYASGRKFARTIVAALTNAYVAGGLMLYGMSIVSWLFVLAGTDVGNAYLFVCLGFVLTMLLTWLILKEGIGAERVFGIVLVVFGVDLVAHS